MLHGRHTDVKPAGRNESIPSGFASLATEERPSPLLSGGSAEPASENGEADHGSLGAPSWKRNVQLMLLCFVVSGLLTILSYFFPILRNIPVFGNYAAISWLWAFNPSLAYVGQGVIMGPSTTLHMLLGAVVGWGMLSPLAHYRGWAPGAIDDWETGSKGWVVWISLAIMLADAVVGLGYLALRPVLEGLFQGKGLLGSLEMLGDFRSLLSQRPAGYTAVHSVEQDGVEDHEGLDATLRPVTPLSDMGSDTTYGSASRRFHAEEDSGDDDDAPADQQVSNRTVAVGLVLSVLVCITCTHVVFGNLVPLFATIIAVMMALVLSIMGVRALGETDLNPVSGISKLAQLFFALIIPQSNKSSVLINLVAGAIVSRHFFSQGTVHSGTCWSNANHSSVRSGEYS
jgi:hypothetical protein